MQDVQIFMYNLFEGVLGIHGRVSGRGDRSETARASKCASLELSALTSNPNPACAATGGGDESSGACASPPPRFYYEGRHRKEPGPIPRTSPRAWAWAGWIRRGLDFWIAPDGGFRHGYCCRTESHEGARQTARARARRVEGRGVLSGRVRPEKYGRLVSKPNGSAICICSCHVCPTHSPCNSRRTGAATMVELRLGTLRNYAAATSAGAFHVQNTTRKASCAIRPSRGCRPRRDAPL